MKIRSVINALSYKELLFQVLLNIIVFIFYSFDRLNPTIETYQLVFFLNYALAALVINYFLLEPYLYKNRYLQFIVYTIIIIAVVIFIEEAVLEKIYFPETRGKRFLGVFYNLLSTMPTITILVGFKFAWDAIVKQREVTELKNSARASELQFLKSQINPHFLFNNMNNLYAHAIEESPKTPDIILELSAVLRYMLYECKAKYVPLSNELEQMKNYINLNRLQIEGRGEVCYVTKNIPSSYRIAPLILMVFIENAFKHSTSSQTGGIKIEVSIDVDTKGVLHFKCLNSYMEQTNTQNLSKGIGLENVKKRLHLLYPGFHTLDIVRYDEMYDVHLIIDLNKTQE